MGQLFLVVGLSIACLIVGCSMAPQLEEATGASDSRIFVRDVVSRIKCELAVAFADKLNGDPRFRWLTDWTVKADLTLQANQQGALSPSGSYTTFQRSAVNTVAGPTTFPGTTLGTVQQFFTLGANANVGEQAVRTEVVSFSLSLKELDDWRRQAGGEFVDFCQITGRPELLGNLGLGEWIDASLAPAATRELLAGKHPSPSLGAKPAQPQIVAKPGPLSVIKIDTFLPIDEKTIRDEIAKALSDAQKAAYDANNSYSSTQDSRDQAIKNYTEAQELQMRYQTISTPETLKQIGKKVTDSKRYQDDAIAADSCTLRQVCGEDYGDCKKFDPLERHPSGRKSCQMDSIKCREVDKPETNSGAVQMYVCVQEAHTLSMDATGSALADLLTHAADAARRARLYADNAKLLATYAQQLAAKGVSTPPDPPIDSIGHSVQFVVAYGAGIAPSWTLIAWKGPALNGPVLSASGTRTHLLQLALGAPTAPAKGSAEQNRIIQNQTILLTRPQ